MNTPKVANRQGQVDRHLKQSLSQWAHQQVPPVRVRRELVRAVRHEAATQGHYLMRQPSDGFVESMYLGPVITFSHCFSMFYSLHSRVRL